MATGAVVCNITNALPKRCAVFDGVDDKINANSITHLESTNVSFTFSAWVKKVGENTKNQENTIMVQGTTRHWMTINLLDKPALWTRNSADTAYQIMTADDAVAWNTWYHIVGVVDASSNKQYIYVNGVGKEMDIVGNKGYSTTFRIGSADEYNPEEEYQRFFNGSIADVKIFNKALSQTEITKLYNGGNITDGLVFQWKLDHDYKDSVGSNDGTNNGSYLTTVDDKVSTAISDARTTANDKYLMAVVNNKIMSAVIEEAP